MYAPVGAGTFRVLVPAATVNGEPATAGDTVTVQFWSVAAGGADGVVQLTSKPPTPGVTVTTGAAIAPGATSTPDTVTGEPVPAEFVAVIVTS